MVLACGILSLVVSVVCTETRGYLYSYYTQSFVSNQNNVTGADSEPLLFTMHVPNHYISSVGWKAHEFEVVSLGYHKNNNHPRYFIEMNTHGEARLKLGSRCEAVYNGRLRIERCSSNGRQTFTWIPEHLLSAFVGRLHRRDSGYYGGRPRLRDNYIAENNSAKSRHRARGASGHRDKKDRGADDLKSIRKTMKNVKKTLLEADKTKTGSLKDRCDNLSGRCVKNGGKYGHLSDKIFNDYLDFFCKNNPISGYCQNRFYGSGNKKDSQKDGRFCISKNTCRKTTSQKKEPFIKRMQYHMEPIFDQKFIRNVTNILKSSGKCMDIYKSPVYVSKTKRPRVRGIFGRGDDSSELSPLECKCKFECIRNPNNGMCYYKADSSGKLVPIMSNESCCSNKRKDMCNVGNKLDKYLCELTIKNDYSSFSKFIDLNYACS